MFNKPFPSKRAGSSSVFVFFVVTNSICGLSSSSVLTLGTYSLSIEQKPIRDNALKINIGVGSSIWAIIGAIDVAIFAITFGSPKAVAANSVGKRNELEIKLS